MKGSSPIEYRLLGLFVLCSALTVIISSHPQTTNSQAQKGTAALSPAEQDLLNEINQARAQPQVYAGYLEKLKPLFKGKQYTTDLLQVETQEGWDAVEDAIKFLRSATPAGPLNASHGLCLAAFSHVKDQSASGATGHAGGDQTLIEQRVRPFGTWQGDIGENLVYGDESARERILTWLIDDGVAGRGHRKRIMSQDYKVAGISCGPHPEYGAMCVLALAGGFNDSGIPQAAAANSNQARTSTGTAKTASKSKPQR
jgi:uncharacterized protein YkwD